MSAVATIHKSNAAIVQRAVVLERKQWVTETHTGGRTALRPEKATWHAYIVKSEDGGADTTVIPLIGCPSCGQLAILTPSPKVAAAVSKMFGKRVPHAHRIDTYGRVAPDMLCMNGSCDFHRTIYLDRWTATGKPLYCIVHTIGASPKLEFTYAHASTRKEALDHLGGGGRYKIIDVGAAVGFFVDERTGKLSTSVGG